MTEEWRPCPGFEMIYSISSFGKVRRDAPGAGRAKPGHILRPGRNPKGYQCVMLCDNGRQETRYIHRLVCEAFHGSPPSLKHQAAHRDDVKENNTPTNLYWATGLQNHADRRRNGKILVGSQIGRAKLKESDIPKIREMREAGAFHKEIAEHFGVAPHTICRIVSGKRWGHIGI